METVETIKIREYEVEIYQDEYPMNPFEDWDCNPSLMVYYDRRLKDYSEGGILDFIQSKISDEDLVKNKSKMAEIDSSYTYEEEEDVEGAMRDDISNMNMEELSQLCDLFGIVHLCQTSRGYRQSDWADVFVIITDEDVERTGFNPEHHKEILEGTFDLYTNWAWGDVYGYAIKEDGSDIDGCGGFYGSDHDESGLMEHVNHFIKYWDLKKNKSKADRVKQLITNKVPLNIREKLIEAL
jgi:hypothetical protein